MNQTLNLQCDGVSPKSECLLYRLAKAGRVSDDDSRCIHCKKTADELESIANQLGQKLHSSGDLAHQRVDCDQQLTSSIELLLTRSKTSVKTCNVKSSSQHDASITDTKSIENDASHTSDSQWSLDETAAGGISQETPARAFRGRGGASHRVDGPHLVLDDYEVVGEIARGGMGVVYKAWDTGLKCHVALKTIRSGEFAGDEHVDRFQREAEATAKLQHPGIVRVHRVGKSSGLHYFTMDLVEGPNLSQLVKQKSLSEEEATRLTIEICEAIDYAHQHGILHRDLKPSNVLTDETGRTLVTDFGLAKRLEDESDFSHTGQALGTPSYMPPEQAAGRRDEIGFHSDVYSIGGLLYHLLTGRPPFEGDSHHGVLDQVFNTEPIPPRKLRANVSRDLDTICLKCLRKQPQHRYASAAELRDDLVRFSHGFPILARPVSLFERAWRLCRRNRAIAALVFAILIVVAGGVFVTNHRDRQIAENFAARLDAAQSRLDSEIARAQLTESMSHDALVPSRVGMDADSLQGALDEYDRVLRDFQDYYGENVKDERRLYAIAGALYRVGQASRLLGDFDRAETSLMHATEQYDSLVALGDIKPEYLTNLGRSLDYLGELYRDHDASDKATSAYLRSLDTLTLAYDTFPNNAETVTELARVQNNYGLLLEENGQLREASERYETSEQLLRQELKREPKSVVNQRDLARTLINIGRLARINSEFEFAKKNYESAISHLQTLVDNDPGNRRLEFLLALTERNLGFLLFEKMNEIKTAQQWLESSLSRFELLPKEISEYQFNHAICLVNLTSLHGQKGGDEITKSKLYFEKSLRVLARLMKQHPTIAEYESWMGVVLGNGAALATIDDDKALAMKRIEQAIDYQNRACEKQPQNRDFATRLQNHQRFKNTLPQ